MNYLPVYKISLFLLSTLLLAIEGTSTQKGPYRFFYQHPEYPRDCAEALEQCSSATLSGVYTIKPDGYPQPFEVYCDNEVSSGGYTVIQRRIDGSVSFGKSWRDYKNGFGFLSGEFWIGNDKLSYLTNQALYELRFDLTLSNGSSFFINYNSFRISDEWSGYTMVSAKEFCSNWDCIVTTCPLNMASDNCACQNLRTEPAGQKGCHTECVETCVLEGCPVTETNAFIMNGESFINANCTQNCTCIDNQLSCYSDYECSTDATCAVEDEIRKCYCNEGYEGDGETCIRIFKDCYEAYEAHHTTDGIYTIFPTDWSGSPFEVFCNMTFGGGGWTVFQRRIDGVTDFYRNWTEYKQGFGTMNQGNDFWLGNEQLHYLTDQKDYILRIDFVHSNGRPYYEEYRTFKIGDESTKYRLSYSYFMGGNTGGSSRYLDYNDGEQFSTHDQDNDRCSRHHYAERHKGGWWYTNNWCTQDCFRSHCRNFEYETSGCYNRGTNTNLNGAYNGGQGENIFFKTYDSNDCNHKFAEMKIRPSN